MPGAHLYGWTGAVWVKLKCDATGKVILDPDSKYTDAKALAACGLDGNQYWSCPGLHFDATNPDVDDIIKSTGGYFRNTGDGIQAGASVNLPHGATVTGAVCYGNAAIEDDSWYLGRLKLTDRTTLTMATAAFNTEDNTITSPVIDNSLYAYFFVTTAMAANDDIHGARITYTI